MSSTTDLRRTDTRRMLRRPRWAFWVLGAALFAMLVSGNLPTPLYAEYRQRFGFTGTVLTLIFAVYALVLIPSLMLFGQLSDRIGRRRVVALGLAAATVGLLLFLLASNTAWLFAARAVQGLALGIIIGTATAALVEQEPRGDRRRAALVATLGQAGGAAVGPVAAGMLAQWAPAPRVLCYAGGAVLTTAVAVAVWRIPEPALPGGPWRPQRPSVPAESRAAFARAALAAGTGWAVGALFLSVVPSYAAALLKSHNLALLGAVPAAMLATACLTQAASQRAGVRPPIGQAAGSVVLICGLAALVGAYPPRSVTLLLTGAVLAGAGLGLAYVGAQTQINQLAPERRRGEVTAAFLTCVYLGVSAAAIAVGLLSDALTLFAAVTIVASAIAAVAAPTAFWHWTRRGDN
ncbi:MFS transporter [Actinoplanes sp. NPDC051513]|uniref:MFS transporter n=1 Tax=Actinoplanes sp. NPDC051513 TaxID=3363908 RepID=UPI0037B0E1B1